MAVVSPFPHALREPALAFHEADAASVGVLRSSRRVCTALSDSAGSSVSTSTGDSESEGTPSSRSEGLLSSGDGRLLQDSAGSLPVALDEPAYIRLAHYPESLSSLASGAQSEMPLSVEGGCSVLGSVWALCQDPAGSRRVQDALDKASSDEARQALLQEFRGRAVKAMRDPHANHVLQKCISVMAPQSLQFMIDELLERDGLATAVARHRYGGRIVQQLLKRCSASQVSGLAEALMQETIALACHTFGNFSVQHLLRFGTEEQRHRLAQAMASDVESLCRSTAGCGVIAATMEHAGSEDRVSIARAVLLQPGLLVGLAQGRHGHSAVLQMLRTLDGQERVQAYASLAGEIATLRASRYGRVMVKHLEELVQNTAVGSPKAHGVTALAPPPGLCEL